MLTLFSDPHLGTARKAHTTPESSKRLNQLIFKQCLKVSRYNADELYNENFCLGDLFDKTNNDEATLLQGAEICKNVDLIMAGNHDVANREGVVSTLHALSEVVADSFDEEGRVLHTTMFCMPPETVGGSTYYRTRATCAEFWVVPHHPSQEAFIRTLHNVMDKVQEAGDHNHYLLLHCNVNFELAGDNDAVLNLPDEMTEQLLQHFKRIFVGHEHNPYTRFDDRLVVVGNTFPTSFSDVSDKYLWQLDGLRDELQKVSIWKKSKHYLELPYGTDLAEVKTPEAWQFIDVVGREAVATGVEVSKYLNDVRKSLPNALMVRQNVELVDVLDRVDVAGDKPALVNLEERIRADLEGSDLVTTWNELHAEASK